MCWVLPPLSTKMTSSWVWRTSEFPTAIRSCGTSPFKETGETVALDGTGVGLLAGQVLGKVIHIVVAVEIDADDQHHQYNHQRKNREDDPLDFFQFQPLPVGRKVIPVGRFAFQQIPQ